MTITDICDGLVYLQRQRVFCIKSQSRNDRSMESFIATLLGFKASPPDGADAAATKAHDAGRKKLFAQAKRIRTEIENGGPNFDCSEWGPQVEGIASMILRSAEARASWDIHRDGVEKKMKDLARTLPGWLFVQSTRGISELGLAVIVGEAGDLGDYANPAKLWKRFGLAIKDGRRQGSVPPNLSKEARAAAWTERGYVGRRRAEIYVFCDDLLCRAQWRAEKTDEDTGEIVPAHAIGPYGEIYARKKAEYLARADGDNPIRSPDAAARRYMSKCFLVDLLRAWKLGSGIVAIGDNLPPSPVDRSLFYLSHLAEAAD
jgi:hypothetical protein